MNQELGRRVRGWKLEKELSQGESHWQHPPAAAQKLTQLLEARLDSPAYRGPRASKALRHVAQPRAFDHMQPEGGASFDWQRGQGFGQEESLFRGHEPLHGLFVAGLLN